MSGVLPQPPPPLYAFIAII